MLGAGRSTRIGHVYALFAGQLGRSLPIWVTCSLNIDTSPLAVVDRAVPQMKAFVPYMARKYDFDYE